MNKRNIINVPPVSEEERKEIMLEAEKPELEKLHDSPDLIMFSNSMICPHPTKGKKVFIDNEILNDDEDDENQPETNMSFISVFDEMTNKLSKREQKIIRLYFEYGYKEREIAQIINISQQLVSYLKNKAIKTMKEYI